jgi:hypothetical protein
MTYSTTSPFDWANIQQDCGVLDQMARAKHPRAWLRASVHRTGPSLLHVDTERSLQVIVE